MSGHPWSCAECKIELRQTHSFLPGYGVFEFSPAGRIISDILTCCNRYYTLCKHNVPSKKTWLIVFGFDALRYSSQDEIEKLLHPRVGLDGIRKVFRIIFQLLQVTIACMINVVRNDRRSTRVRVVNSQPFDIGKIHECRPK
jgi:hypothetical protein